MSMVDNRVVKMTFDNVEFEKKIKGTMQTLSEFEKSLKMDGAAAGFEKIKNAADKLNLSILGDKAKEQTDRIGLISSEAAASISKIDDAAQNADFSQLSDSAEDAVMDINNVAAQTDMSPVVDEANDAAESFNMLEAVAVGVLIGIGNEIKNLIMGPIRGFGNTIKDYTIQPMIDGFKEYETQMGAIQTIMANTGLNFSSDEDIKLVNDRLDELNEYADLTIYNFTEMTKNIGTFTAAGVDLDTSVSAIKGIANLAALSGSNSQQASTAMYQLSQALSTGTLKLQDWNSVVNAGMGGKVFQNALKETARAHGVAVDEMIENNGSFRESLQEGWITSEILTETLDHMAISYKQVGDKAYNAALEKMVENGYTEKQAKSILRLAKTAEQSATKVRTWTQLWDTVKESIGSQWSQIWRNFIGDFKQATDTFTFLSNSISNGVEALFGGMIRASKAFQKSSAFDVIFGGYKKTKKGNDFFDKETGEMVRIKGALDYLVEAISKPLNAIKTAFDDIFEISWDDLKITILSLALAFKDFSQGLIISDMAALGVHRIFEGLFSIFKIGMQVVGDLIAVFFGFINVLRRVTDPITDIILVFGGQFGKVLAWVEDRFREIREAILLAFEPLADAAILAMDFIAILLGLDGLPQEVADVGNAFIDLLDKLWDLVDIPGIIEKIGDGIKGILHFIGDLTGWNDAIKEAVEATENGQENVSVLDIFIKNLLKNPVVAFFMDIYESILAIPSAIIEFIDSIVDLFHSTEENTEETTKKLDAFALIYKSLCIIIRTGFRIIQTAATLIYYVLSPILSLVETIFSVIGDFIKGNIVGVWQTLVSIITTVFNLIKTIATYLGGTVIYVFSTFSDVIVRLFGAFGTLGGKLIKFVSKLKIVKDATKYVGDLKDKLVDFFTKGLSDNIGGSTLPFIKSMDTIRTVIDEVRKKIDGFIEYIENVSAKQFLKDIVDYVSGFKDGIMGKFNELSDFLNSFDPYEMLVNFISGLKNVKEKAYDVLDSIFDYLDETFPEATESIEEVYDILFNVITGIFDGLEKLTDIIGTPLLSAFYTIRNALQDIRNDSEDFPTFIGNLIGTIITLVIKGIGNLIGTIGKVVFYAGTAVVAAVALIANGITKAFKALLRGEGLEGVRKAFGEFGSNLVSTLKNKLKDISPALADAFDKIDEFFSKSDGESKSWKDKIKDAFGAFSKQLEKIPTIAKNSFNQFKDSATEAFKSITDSLSTIEGPIGSFFGNIKNKLDEADKAVEGSSENISGNMENMTEKTETIVDKLKKAVKQFFVGSDDSENSEDGGVLGSIIKLFGDVSKTTMDKLKEVPGMIGDFFNSILENITKENVDRLVDLLQHIVEVKLMWSLGDFAKGIGKLAKAFSKRIDPESGKSVRKKMRDWAITFTIIAAALWIVSTIKNPWECFGIITAVMAVVVVMEALSAVITKFLGKGGTQLLASASSLLVLCIGIFAMMKAIEALNEFDFEKNEKGLTSFRVILGILVGVAVILSWIGGNNAGFGILAAAASLAIMSIGVSMMIGPIKKICDFANSLNEDEFERSKAAMLALAGFIVAIGLAMGLAGNHALAAGIGFVLVAASISVIAEALMPLIEIAKVNFWPIVIVMGAFAAILGEFAYIAYKVDSKDLLLASVAMVIFSAATSIIAEVFTKLTEVANANPFAFVSAFAAIALIIGEFAAIAKFVDSGDLLKASAAILIFSVSVGIIALAIKTLAETNGDIMIAAIAIGIILGIFGTLAFILSLPVLNGGATVVLLALAAAFIALGAACLMISIALQNTVNAIIQLAEHGQTLTDFVILISQHVGQFVLAAVGLTLLGAAFIVFGAGAIVAGAGLVLLSTGIREFLQLIIDLPTLLENASGSINNLIQTVPNALSNTWENIKSWFSNGIVPGLATFIGFIKEKFENFKAMISEQWEIWKPKIFNKLREFKDRAIEGFKKAATKVINKFKEVKNNIGNTVKEAIKNIPEKMSEAVNNITDNLKAIGKNILDGLLGGMTNFDALSAIQNAVNTVSSWIPDDIKKFFQIGSPSKLMEDEVGQYISEGIAVGMENGGDSVRVAASSLGEEVFDGLISALDLSNLSVSSPTISPVVDMSQASSGLNSYNAMVEELSNGGNIVALGEVDGELSYSSQLASKIDDEMSATNNMTSSLDGMNSSIQQGNSQTEYFYGQITELILDMNQEVSQIKSGVEDGKNIYMDSGTLVGAIAPEMDHALGWRTALAERGVY